MAREKLIINEDASIANIIGNVIGYTWDESNNDAISKREKKILIELICNEQTRMIVDDHTQYDSARYKDLETLKIKIKDM